MAKLNRCPVCGRDPKMMFETMPDGVTALVRLECRGMFRLHCAVDAADYYQADALVRAEKKWNKATEELAQERKMRHG